MSCMAAASLRVSSGHLWSAGPDTPRPGPPAQTLLPMHAVGLEPLEWKKAHQKGTGIGVKGASFQYPKKFSSRSN